MAVEIVTSGTKTFGRAATPTGPRRKVAFVYMNNEANIGRGAGYIAAVIRDAGHDVTFYNSLYTPIDEIARRVVEDGTEALLISTMTLIFPQAVKLVRLVKARRDVPVLVGGIHPTLEREKVLEAVPEIDFACVGEGEVMVTAFLEKFTDERVRTVPNLLYRDNGTITATPLIPATDLASLPRFPWEYFRRDNVVQPDIGFTYVTASRGCPYSCTYCCNIVYLKTYKKSYLRTRPVDSVIAELRWLKENHNPWLYYFGDEMLLFDLDYVRELFSRFKAEIGGRFGLQGRVEFLDDDTVKFLADCGCRYVALGAECGDEEFCQKVLRRRISNDMLAAAVERLKRNRIFVTTFNMIGYPVDNDDYLTLQTIRMNERLRPNYTQISVFFPFPGTVLADMAWNADLVDQEKIEAVTEYFSESVLKDRAYLTDLRQSLHNLFNPRPFPNIQEMEAWEKGEGHIGMGSPRSPGLARRLLIRLRASRRGGTLIDLAKRIPGAQRLARTLR